MSYKSYEETRAEYVAQMTRDLELASLARVVIALIRKVEALEKKP
jgi:hypothetical protein